jgi:hypothetical protein
MTNIDTKMADTVTDTAQSKLILNAWGRQEVAREETCQVRCGYKMFTHYCLVYVRILSNIKSSYLTENTLHLLYNRNIILLLKEIIALYFDTQTKHKSTA